MPDLRAGRTGMSLIVPLLLALVQTDPSSCIHRPCPGRTATGGWGRYVVRTSDGWLASTDGCDGRHREGDATPGRPGRPCARPAVRHPTSGPRLPGFVRQHALKVPVEDVPGAPETMVKEGRCRPVPSGWPSCIQYVGPCNHGPGDPYRYCVCGFIFRR